jgi:ribosomal protein S18 acetylase RimI-like enzyme
VYLLSKANGSVLVDEEEGVVRGYVLLLFRKGRKRARLYSIAVDPRMQGRGVGRGLVKAAEDEARARGMERMSLEIRLDNSASQALFRGAGYLQVGQVDDYYEDHMGALVFEKSLIGDV